LLNAYGDKFLSLPPFPKLAEVAEYISLILFLRQNLNTSKVPARLDSKHLPKLLKL